MYRLRLLSFILFISIIFFACTKENNAPSREFHHDYYPLKLKQVLIYDVDSTFHNNFNGSVTNYKFELKDSVASVFLNLTGDSIFRVERYKKEPAAGNWTYQKTITRNRTLRIGQETIENQTFNRLIFPPEVFKDWNGNSKNTLGEQFYYISDFPFTATVNNQTFDSTIVVQQIDEVNLIREDIASEIYAKNIGLIQKDVTAIDKDISSGRITHGFIYSMKIKSF
jgi:hypothetical protein